MFEFKINKLAKKTHLQEISQTYDVKFALGDFNSDFTEFTQKIQESKCRDFLLDAFYVNHHPSFGEYYIYGMKYDVAKNPIDLDRLGLYMEFPVNKPELLENFKRNVGKLDYILDDNFGLIYWQVDNVLIIYPPTINTCLALNLFTLLLKCLCFSGSQSIYDNVMQVNSPEKQYLTVITRSGFEKIFRSYKKINKIVSDTVSGYPSGSSIQHIHDKSGIVSNLRAVQYNDHKHLTKTQKVLKQLMKAAAKCQYKKGWLV